MLRPQVLAPNFAPLGRANPHAAVFVGPFDLKEGVLFGLGVHNPRNALSDYLFPLRAPKGSLPPECYCGREPPPVPRSAGHDVEVFNVSFGWQADIQRVSYDLLALPPVAG